MEKIITIKADADFHKKLKVRAAEQGLTIRNYVMALVEQDKKKDKEKVI